MQKILFLTVAIFLGGCSTFSQYGFSQNGSVCQGSVVKGCQPIVYFDVDESKLTSQEKENLNWVVEKLERFERRHVNLIGHADPTGDIDQNLVLSEKRADAVKDYLVEQGIDEDRIHTDFKGDAEPVCHEDECHERSRRVEVEIYTHKTNWLY